MKLYLQHLNKADLPATDAILRKVLDVELKEKPINKPNARIYAGYEEGTYNDFIAFMHEYVMPKVQSGIM